MEHDGDFDPTTATLADATAVLGRDETRIYAAELAVTTARERYERALADPHADLIEVRERIEAEFGAALRSAETAALTLARTVNERARGVMASATMPGLLLAAGETVQAGAFAPFAEADCRDLALGDLIGTVRAAVVANDRARMFAYSRFLPKRLAPVGADAGRSESANRERAELRRLLGVITERLADPAFAAAHARAYALSEKARELATPIDRQRLRADLAAGKVRFGFQRADDVSWDQG